MAEKHGVPASTFRDMFRRQNEGKINPRTGMPYYGHKSSHLQLLGDTEEWVSFIYLTWLASLPN